MEGDNQSQNTANKGVFPGANAAPGTIKVGQPVQTNPSPAPAAPVVENATEQPAPNQGTKTFIRLETKNTNGEVSGIIEVDLISFRERGQENRYLSIDVVGASQDGNQSNTNIAISNEQDFNAFKEFISNLNWND